VSIAEVQRIHIIAHSGVKLEVLSSLQEEGVVQVEKANFEELNLKSSSAEVGKVEHRLYRLSHALTYLSQWEEKGFAKRLFAQKPQLSQEKKKDILNFEYLPVLDDVERLEAEKNELFSEIRFLEKEKESLSPLSGFELPLQSLKITDSIEILIGSIPQSLYEDFLEISGEEAVWHEVINRDKRKLHLLLIYLKRDYEPVERILKELNFAQHYLTEPVLTRADAEDTVDDIMRKINQEIEKKKIKLEDLDKDGRRLSGHSEMLMFVHDILLNEKGKVFTSGLLGETERVFYLDGWICSSDIEKLKSRLEPYSGGIELYFRAPLPEEDPPVVLENPKPGKPFELITKLYGLPRRGSFDPTLALAPFFFLFVGLCVSEAGYGLLVALLSFLYIKFAKPKGGLRQFLKLLGLLGVSTVLALALGFIQVWFGTLLNLISGIKNKLYLQSICVQGGWLLLLPSLVLFLGKKGSIWGIFTLVGAAGIVFFASPSRNPFARFFGGLYSLYDISRYLADVLSYSRLLALGLATTVIAMVVNNLSQTALGIPWVGWLVAALIFVGGHLFNLAISFLGGFVHSMRLQFVEFFSKFFKSGGSPFKPFELESKFVEFI
jgi:V/A-type H+-transporting ATPase subunit I